jgi:DNA-binding response OmpR family regulator
MSDQGTHGKIVVMIRDLFFSVKVKNELTNAGYEPLLVKREPELLSTVEASNPSLVLLDLGTNPDWQTLQPLLENESAPPILAFGPHKDIDGRREAQAAGVTRVVTNQQLHKNLQDYVERYIRREA